MSIIPIRSRVEPVPVWEPCVDRLVAAVWQGKEATAAKAILPLQIALRQAETHRIMDAHLLKALYRVAVFYCLERRFADCESLLAAVHRVQERAPLMGLANGESLSINQFLEIGVHLERLKQMPDPYKNTVLALWSHGVGKAQNW